MSQPRVPLSLESALNAIEAFFDDSNLSPTQTLDGLKGMRSTCDRMEKELRDDFEDMIHE